METYSNDQENWQEQNEEQTNGDLDLRSAEAGGYGTDDTRYEAASDRDDEEDDADNDTDDLNDDDDDLDDDDTEDDDTDDGTPSRDWGDVDPEHGGGRSSMDPSGPGSAV